LSSRTEPTSTSTTRAMCTNLLRGNPLIMTFQSALTWVPAVKSLRPIAQCQWKHFVSLIVSTPDPKVPAKTFRFSRSSSQGASSMLSSTRSPGLTFKLERLLENSSFEFASVMFWCFLKIKIKVCFNLPMNIIKILFCSKLCFLFFKWCCCKTYRFNIEFIRSDCNVKLFPLIFAE